MKAALSIIFLFAFPSVFATTIVVKLNGKVSTVQQAVKLAAAGDTVLIKRGTYHVHDLVITKSLSLIGEQFPTFHGGDKFRILTVSGKNISVKGVHFSHSGYSSMSDLAAITVVDANNITIEGNRFSNTFFGIHVSNSHHFIIRNNVLKGITRTEQTTGNGIHLWKCSYALIEQNNSSGHRDGIYFEFVNDSQIQHNISHENIRYGLHFMFSNSNLYAHNIFRNNGAGVAVMFSKQVTMHHNTFERNWGPAAYGILLKEISDSRIFRNKFIENTVAIYMEGANRIEVANNDFRQNGWASKVQASCSDNNYHHNNFFGNTFDIATNGSLVLNKFSQNYWDKYEGYDLDRDDVGDVPYHPVSLYSMLIEQNSNSLMLLRSFMVTLLDKAEKAIPSLTPENLRDDRPLMKSLKND